MRRSGCGVTKARDKLTSLVRAAERGRTIEITRRGKPVAVLISAAEHERLTAARPSFGKFLREFLKKRRPEDSLPDDYFTNLRDRSPGRDFSF